MSGVRPKCADRERNRWSGQGEEGHEGEGIVGVDERVSGRVGVPGGGWRMR